MALITTSSKTERQGGASFQRALDDRSAALSPFNDEASNAAERPSSGALAWIIQRELYADMLILLDGVVFLLTSALASAATVYGASFDSHHLAAVTAVGAVTSALFISFQFLLGSYRRHHEVSIGAVFLTSAKALFLTIGALWMMEHLVMPAILDFEVIYVHFISLPQAIYLLAAGLVSAGAQIHMAKEVSVAFSSSALQPRRIALVGDPTIAAHFLNRLPLWRWGYEMAGFYCDAASASQLDEVEANKKAASIKGLDDLIALARADRLDDILIATADNNDDRLNNILDALSILPVRLYATPSLAIMSQRRLHPSQLGSQPVFELIRPGIYGRRVIIKKAMDLSIAMTALPVFLVIFPLIALAIKLDSSGPILFRQPRQGYNDKVFHIFKFRTMTVQEKGQDVTQATKNDPRVTRVGKILRKLSLDELPQLINVLRGDMSIVGPRPQVAKQNVYYSDFITRYARRHTVLPGITGWAQISGLRGETGTPDEMEARVKHDIYYVENWSLTLDLYILVRTLFVFFSKKAY